MEEVEDIVKEEVVVVSSPVTTITIETVQPEPEKSKTEEENIKKEENIDVEMVNIEIPTTTSTITTNDTTTTNTDTAATTTDNPVASGSKTEIILEDNKCLHKDIESNIEKILGCFDDDQDKKVGGVEESSLKE